MRLTHGRHLAYCTNIHRGESWPETFANLQRYALAVRSRICPDQPYAIGLRLSHQAARELSERAVRLEFQRWLAANACYVFTINGFPFGRFHGSRIKERVYMPDWTSPERLEYTNCLFDLLSELVPTGVAGSVSTVPGSFKEFIRTEEQASAMRANLWRCVDHLAQLSDRTGRSLHLGLEPEPLCYLETSQETVRFFEQLRDDRPGDPRLEQHLGVNYDACHLAVEFEEPAAALGRLARHGIQISKIHLSSALKVRPTPAVREALRAFRDETYLHQVVVRDAQGDLQRYADLDRVLDRSWPTEPSQSEEWRIHFHLPLHSRPELFFDAGTERNQTDFAGLLGQRQFDSTVDHLLGVLDIVQARPDLCAHFEMETYTWEVLPPELKQRNVVDQLVAEYAWTLAQFAARGIGPVE